MSSQHQKQPETENTQIQTVPPSANRPAHRFLRPRWIALGIAALALAAALVGVLIHKPAEKSETPAGYGSEPVSIGKNWSNKHCQGEGAKELTNSPMQPDDFTFIVPYGLMVDDHVTPIDHQYFSPASYQSSRDAYEVYAMADGLITEIEHRTEPPQGGRIKDEYRMEFTETCTFFYYYDLVTSLTPEIQTAFDENSKGRRNTDGRFAYPVKAGQLIGRIGGQTLDFAVWDTTKPLTGFIKPSSYEAEPWKIFTADPLDYYSPELKEFMLSRYIRTAEPISGKIDYDQPGKLIGNWFKEGSGGYGGQRGTEGQSYSNTHLAIAPEHYDPSVFVVSIGDYNGRPEQFLTKSNSPWPTEVSAQSGPVKYELAQIGYQTPDGQHWDRNSLVRGIKAVPNRDVSGTVLFELIGDGSKLKFEIFPNKKAADVSGFTSAAKIYER